MESSCFDLIHVMHNSCLWGSLSNMPPTRIIVTFSVSIIFTFFIFVDSINFIEQFNENQNDGELDSFYAKLCSGFFDNESAEERVVDRTFECQSIYLVNI